MADEPASGAPAPEEAAPAPAGEGVVVRRGTDGSQADEWSLVLTALAVPHAVEHVDEQLELRTPPARAGEAAAQLSGYEAEQHERAQAAPLAGAPRLGPQRVGWGVAVVLLALHTSFGPLGAPGDGPRSPAFARGMADAGALRAGELWRSLTALTLHADLGHALGNALAGGFLISALAREVGPGAAVWIALLAGGAGNWITAALVPAGYRALGASTAVFGALGALTAVHAFSRAPQAGRRAWVILAAGLALLGLLGTGAQADLLGHLFGFLAGAALGALAAAWVRRGHEPREGWGQHVLVILAAAALGLAWHSALAPGSQPG